MSHSPSVVLQGIAGPDAAIGVVKSVIVGVEATFFPSQVTGQYRPHFAYKFQVAGPAKMPEQFVYVAEVHVVVVHGARIIGITGYVA